MTDDWAATYWPSTSAMDTTSDAGVNHTVMDNDPAMASLFHKIKHLQDEGIYMNRFYASPVCTPSRKQALSGRYVYSQGNGDWNPLRSRYTTVAEKLKLAGYATAGTGKWHVGHKNSALWPRQRGFDSYKGIPFAGLGDFYTYVSYKEGTSSGDLSSGDRRCSNGDVIHDLMWENEMPSMDVRSDPTINTWPGSPVIRSGYEHFGSPYDSPISVERNDSYRAYDLLKAHEAGDVTALPRLQHVNDKYMQTNNTLKFVQEEALRIIDAHANPETTPLFHYIAPVSMRVPGTDVNTGTLSDQQYVYSIMKTQIENCDHWKWNYYKPGEGIRALYEIVKDGVDDWDENIEQDIVNEYFCDDEAKRVRFNTLVMAYTADRLIGELKDALVHKNMWENTLFVSRDFNLVPTYLHTDLHTDLHRMCVCRSSPEIMGAGRRLVSRSPTGLCEAARTPT